MQCFGHCTSVMVGEHDTFVMARLVRATCTTSVPRQLAGSTPAMTKGPAMTKNGVAPWRTRP
jgi:hypothetical protein